MEKAIKHIAFLVVPNATLLDITGPYEAFSLAAECLQSYGYRQLAQIIHKVS